MPQSTLELQTNDPDALLRLSAIERFSDSSGYRCELEVRSRGFSGSRPFYFEEFGLRLFLEGLEKMRRLEVAEATLQGQWESDFLRFKSNALGQIVVDGAISEPQLGQGLKFAFCTDQTVLADFERGLLQWLAA